MGLRTAIYKPHPQDETNTDLNIHKQIHIKSKDRPSQYTPQSKTKKYIYVWMEKIQFYVQQWNILITKNSTQTSKTSELKLLSSSYTYNFTR